MLSPKIFFTLFSFTLFLSSPLQGSAKADSLLQTLTLDEKIGQMILVYHSPVSFLLKHHIGGVLIMSNMLKKGDRLKNQIDSIQTLSKIKLFVSIDQEGGRINRLQALPQWKSVPSAQSLKTWNHDSITQLSYRIGMELNKYSINMNLAPVLDPNLNHLGQPTFLEEWERSFGRNASDILPPAYSFIKGFHQAHIACISKHFPGYDAVENSDLAISISKAESSFILQNIETFTQSFPKVEGVMMSSILYKNLSDLPAVLSPQVVSLARKNNPHLMVMTDDLWGTALRSFAYPQQKIHPVKYPDKAFIQLVTQAFLAGNDVLMITFPQKIPLIQKAIKQAFKQDPHAIQLVNNACRRILYAKEKMGLLKN